MNCASCGAKLKGTEAFCPQCGATQRSMAELVALAKQGDEQAISDLYGRTYNAVYASVKAKARVDEDTVLLPYLSRVDKLGLPVWITCELKVNKTELKNAFKDKDVTPAGVSFQKNTTLRIR